eukprot:m.43566 g.43566  ORF g.43566 m.43566 type:complete len:283 (-) comp6161_c1_seq1:100-948(-)
MPHISSHQRAGDVRVCTEWHKRTSTAPMTSVEVKDEVNHHERELAAIRDQFAGPHQPRAIPLSEYTGSTSGKTKIVFFVRHGQGHHNLAAIEAGHGCLCKEEAVSHCPYMDEALLDPPLTAEGRAQAEALQDAAAGSNVSVILVSPLTRALETATIGFARCTDVPFVALESSREQNGRHPCDKRRSVNELAKDFPHVNFDLVESNEDVLWSPSRESKVDLARRAGEVIAAIAERPEERIALVCHSAFLLTLFLTQLNTSEAPSLRTFFATGEMRPVALIYPE